MSHPENNPYFVRPTQHQRGDSRGSRSRHGSGVSQQPRRHGQDNMPSGSIVTRTRHEEPSPDLTPGPGLVQEPREDQHGKPHSRGITLQDPHEDQHSKPHSRGIALHEPHEDQHSKPHGRGIVLQEPNQDQRSKPHGRQQHEPQFQSQWVLPPHGQIQPTKPHDTKHGSQYGVPSPRHQDHGHDPHHQDERPLRQGTPHDQENRRRHRSPYVVPKPQKTRAITWFGAVFCAIFWIVIFLGGLIVLIVYLMYRPRNPRFDVSSVTLNAAYVDAGSMLNADLSMLVNFTNPNKKARVDFNTMIIDLYYGPSLISTQIIQPFSAARTQSRFVNLHMVTSQVSLSTGQIQQLQQQISKNGIIFDVKGVFRVRSNLGSFLRYSYRLYSHCKIEVTSPPTGVLRATRCRTKR